MPCAHPVFGSLHISLCGCRPAGTTVLTQPAQLLATPSFLVPAAEEQNAKRFAEALSRSLFGKAAAGQPEPVPAAGKGASDSSGGQEESGVLPPTSPFELRILEVALELVCLFLSCLLRQGVNTRPSS